MRPDQFPKRAQTSLKKHITGIPVSDGSLLGPLRDDRLKVVQPAQRRGNAIIGNRRDFNPRRLQQATLAGKETVRDSRKRFAIARGAECRDELAPEPAEMVSIERGQNPTTNRGGCPKGGRARAVACSGLPRFCEGGSCSRRACARPAHPGGIRSRNLGDAGPRSSIGIRTWRVPSETSRPRAVRVGKVWRPFPRAEGNPSFPAPGSSQPRSRPRARRSLAGDVIASTSRAIHPGPRITSSSRHITHGAVPRYLARLRARAIVSQRLGSSARGGPASRWMRRLISR